MQDKLWMICEVVFHHCRPLGVYAAESEKAALAAARKDLTVSRLWGMVAVPLEDPIVSRIVELNNKRK